MTQFGFAAAPEVRSDLREALVATWSHLARPGTWWDATERRWIAATARAARAATEVPDVPLGEAAIEAATVLASTPAQVTETWVAAMTEALGEEHYVELLGITTRVVAVDTFTRLLGAPLEPFPDPEWGPPTRIAAEPRPAKVRTWIPLGNVLVPPFTLSLVPDENTMTNRLAQTLYMTGADMDDPDFRRGDLHRTQIELVASTLSYENECFY